MRLEDRIVDQTDVGPWFVSTVLLPEAYHDRAFYETMVFLGDSAVDVYDDRYQNVDEALLGHAKAVAWAESHSPDDVGDNR